MKSTPKKLGFIAEDKKIVTGFGLRILNAIHNDGVGYGKFFSRLFLTSGLAAFVVSIAGLFKAAQNLPAPETVTPIPMPHVETMESLEPFLPKDGKKPRSEVRQAAEGQALKEAVQATAELRQAMSIQDALKPFRQIKNFEKTFTDFLDTDKGQQAFEKKWLGAPAEPKTQRLAIITLDDTTNLDANGKNDHGVTFVRKALSESPKGMTIAVTGSKADLAEIVKIKDSRLRIFSENIEQFMIKAKQEFNVTEKDEIAQTVINGAVAETDRPVVQAALLKAEALSQYTIIAINGNLPGAKKLDMSELFQSIQSEILASQKAEVSA